MFLIFQAKRYRVFKMFSVNDNIKWEGCPSVTFIEFFRIPAPR